MLSLLLAVAFAQTNDPCVTTVNHRTGASAAVAEKSREIDRQILRQIELAPPDRVQIVCDIREAVRLQYSGVDLKRERQAIDVDKEITDCARAEAEVEDGNRLKFTERVQICLARIRDSHLSAASLVPVPQIFTLVEGRYYGGKYFIATLNKKLTTLAQQRTGLQGVELLAPGNEILEVDGLPVEQALQRLTPYISSSTGEAREFVAAMNLLSRTFAFPEKNFIELKIQPPKGEATTIRLPWISVSNERSSMPEASQALRNAGIPFINDIGFSFDETKSSWTRKLYTEFEGFDNDVPLVPDNQLAAYANEDNRVVFRLGEILKSRRDAFCYLEILSFEP